jgi:anti-sigma regulatory factor (Ser/Thr protein kinase)
MSGAGPHSPPATARPARPGTGPQPHAGEGAWPFTDTLNLGALPSAVPCARLHTRAILTEWGLRYLAEDAELVTSELITNAIDASIVLPARPPITLRLLADHNSLVIEVWDHSPLNLEPRQADPGDECGRGLTVIAALSQHWDWQRTSPRRKVVWAELTR